MNASGISDTLLETVEAALLVSMRGACAQESAGVDVFAALLEFCCAVSANGGEYSAAENGEAFSYPH